MLVTWRFHLALACTLASMALGGYLGALTQDAGETLGLIGPAHAICVGGCFVLVRRWGWGVAFVLASVIFPCWGYITVLAGAAVAYVPLSLFGIESEFMMSAGAFAMTSIFWTVLVGAGLGSWRVLLYGMAPLLVSIGAIVVVNPAPDLASVYGSPIAVWHVLMPPAILIAAVQARERLEHQKREARRRRGLCGECSYPVADLPGTACPECGAAFVPSRAATDEERIDKAIGPCPASA